MRGNGRKDLKTTILDFDKEEFLPIITFYSVVLNVPFCPIVQKLRRNECEVSIVKIPQHKSHKK